MIKDYPNHFFASEMRGSDSVESSAHGEAYLDDDTLCYISVLGDRRTATAMAVTCNRLHIYFISRYITDRCAVLNGEISKRMESYIISPVWWPIDLNKFLLDNQGLVFGNTIRNVAESRTGTANESDYMRCLSCLFFLKSLGERRSLLEGIARELIDRLNASDKVGCWVKILCNRRAIQDGSKDNYMITRKGSEARCIILSTTELSIEEYTRLESESSWEALFFDGERLLIPDDREFVNLIDRRKLCIKRGILRTRQPQQELYKLSVSSKEGYKICLDSSLSKDEACLIKSMLQGGLVVERPYRKSRYETQVLEDLDDAISEI